MSPYQIPAYHLLWAKTQRQTGRTHPLICHLVDVAQVALALWKTVLTGSIRAQFADALGLKAVDAGQLIAFWAGLHDIGKASPAFQRLHKPAETFLTQAGLSFPRLFVQERCPHGTISARVLETLLESETQMPPRWAKRVARAVGGHHGSWPSPKEVQDLSSSQLGGGEWDAVRQELVRVLRGLWSPPVIEKLGRTPQEENAFVTLLSGLTSTADWIGSMEEHFPYVTGPVDPAAYARSAQDQAERTLDRLGWTGWKPPTEVLSFHQMFNLFPRPLQEAVVELADGLEQPALVIIEAPTGVGKTEAALYLADRWAHAHHQRGLYVAMPTMATSNQMFSRVQKALRQRYPEDLVNLHLVHSQARWSDDMQSLRLETADEHGGGTVAAMAWFLPRKRSLLAPFGVGTVDQALLSVLQTRHFFVRLFGLSHKTIIFDEVHAYDTYMSAIFQRLLSWLRAAGTSAIILSATLPASTRRDLLRAYTGNAEEDPPATRYPAITWATGGRTGATEIAAPTRRSVNLEWIDGEPQLIASRLAAEMGEGGCAAVICNTVARAQEVYLAVKAADPVPEEDLILFHARFPLAWRNEIETRVLSSFGKEGARPHAAIVVATQVIEQSLDLDFDLMVTDLAPADLVLQRIGRLHRHERESRPGQLTRPRLLITVPVLKDGSPDFGQDAYIYERYILLRTLLALKDRRQITLPDDTTEVIEAVYGDPEQALDTVGPDLAGALGNARKQMECHEREHVYKARQKLIPDPATEAFMNRPNLDLEEDSPDLHEAFQALTRLTRPGIAVVCLHRTRGELNLEPDGTGMNVDPSEEPGAELTKDISAHTVTVTHPVVVQYMRKQPVPAGWREQPLLHNHRLAVFEDSLCPLPGTACVLRLTRELGLQTKREVQ